MVVLWTDGVGFSDDGVSLLFSRLGVIWMVFSEETLSGMTSLAVRIGPRDCSNKLLFTYPLETFIRMNLLVSSCLIAEFQIGVRSEMVC